MGQLSPMKVQLFESDGVIIPSRMGSYLIWRKLHQGKLKPTPLDENGLCKICGGFQIIDTKEYGTMWCLCHMNEQTMSLAHAMAKYETMLAPKTLEELKPVHGGMDKVKEFLGVVEFIRKWYDNPNGWITLMGPPGVGKTHILSAIKQKFGSWALYITASDFESQVFQAMKEDRLDNLIEYIRKVPILLFDDLGSEYVKDGRDFVRSNLRKIIDFRYKMALEYPTIIATNLSPDALRMYDQRIFDRILDESVVGYARMNFSSWRTQGLDHANT